jgi:hypothetical protein
MTNPIQETDTRPMDTDTLAEAYQRLENAALFVAASPAPTEQQRADTDWTLAHVALSDLMLAEAARHLSAGDPVRIDNSTAMSPTAIRELIETTEYQERVDLVAARGAELVGLIARQGAQEATASVEVHLVDSAGRTSFEGTMTWGEIVHARGTVQIPGHAARLAGYASGPTFPVGLA